MNDAFVEELSESICALANEPEGGTILICEENSYSTILKGLVVFSREDSNKLK